MKSNTAAPVPMIRLIRRLGALEVELDRDVQSSADQLLRLGDLAPAARPRPPEDLLGLSDAEMSAALREFGVAIALAGVGGQGGPGGEAIREMSVALAAAIGNALVEDADKILDQLRPRFHEAAAQVHAAVELGINPGTVDVDILRAPDVAAQRDAWASLPVAARVLDEIAMTRVELSTVAGVPPAERRQTIDEIVTDAERRRLARSMFGTDLAYFSDKEDGWQRWLRMCAHGPAELLPVAGSLDAYSVVKRTDLAVLTRSSHPVPTRADLERASS